MKKIKFIKARIRERRSLIELERKRTKERKRIDHFLRRNSFIKKYPNLASYILSKEDSNIFYLLNNSQSYFHKDKLNFSLAKETIDVPEFFSLITNAKESYKFIQKSLCVLLGQRASKLELNYKNCNHIDVGAQVILDIILKDYKLISNEYKDLSGKNLYLKKLGGKNINNEEVRKMLFTIGSPRILNVGYIRACPRPG
jgi:hypothetical protein